MWLRRSKGPDGNVRNDNFQEGIVARRSVLSKALHLMFKSYSLEAQSNRGNKLSKLISVNITDRLYIDELKVFAAFGKQGTESSKIC